jgi:hypothetical protein
MQYFKNFSPGDGYLPANGQILQMTTGKSYSINASGVENVLGSRIFGAWQDKYATESIKCIFVVHTSVFDDYTEPQSFNYGECASARGVEQVPRHGKIK